MFKGFVVNIMRNARKCRYRDRYHSATVTATMPLPIPLPHPLPLDFKKAILSDFVSKNGGLCLKKQGSFVGRPVRFSVALWVRYGCVMAGLWQLRRSVIASLWLVYSNSAEVLWVRYG